MLQPLLRPAAVAANDRLRGASPILLPEPPLLDLDFVGRPSLAYPGLPTLAFTRASEATYRDSSGARQTAAVDEPRFDHDANGNPLGLLLEETRTNFLLNSTTPVTQTTGSLATGTYMLWVEGSGSAEAAANTATITGAGTATEGSPVTFFVTGAGAVDVTVTGTLTAFQLEKMQSTFAFPTSLIVTAGATVTRASDVCDLATAGWFNAAEGSALFVGRSGAVGGSFADYLINLDDGVNPPNTEQIDLRVRATAKVGMSVAISPGGGQVATSSVASAAANVRMKGAMAWKANDFASCLDGEAPVTDTSGSLPTIARLRIANAQVTGSDLALHVERLAYFPRRLPDGVLQALTK